MRRRVQVGIGVLLLGGLGPMGLRHAASRQTNEPIAVPEEARLAEAGAADEASAEAFDASVETSPDRCPLCANDPGAPIVELHRRDVEAAAHQCAERNEATLARLDSLLRAGTFGRPETTKARRSAHLLARLCGRNAYHEMFRYALDAAHVYQASESTLASVFRDYSDPGLFTIAHLKQLRMGLGRVCLRYDLSTKSEGTTVLGGRELQVQVEDVTVRGKQRRVLHMRLPSGSSDVVEVLLTDHYTFQVEHHRVEGPPAPYELFLVHDVRGGWVRKWGTHHPTAFMFYATPCNPARVRMLPAEPLVGVRIYVPHIRLRLPAFLPTVGLEDLRELNLPQPILDMTYLSSHRYPEWLRGDPRSGFSEWVGVGPLPPELRRRFPDL